MNIVLIILTIIKPTYYYFFVLNFICRRSPIWFFGEGYDKPTYVTSSHLKTNPKLLFKTLTLRFRIALLQSISHLIAVSVFSFPLQRSYFYPLFLFFSFWGLCFFFHFFFLYELVLFLCNWNTNGTVTSLIHRSRSS